MNVHILSYLAFSLLNDHPNNTAAARKTPSDTWRLVATGLRKTGETVYDFGVAAENVTAEATEVC